MGHQLCIYDTLLHVPLIIRYPALFEAGLRLDEQVQTTSLFPTLLDILSIDWDSDEIQGCSLLEDGENCLSDFAIAEYATVHNMLSNMKILSEHRFDFSTYARRLKTIRIGEFKYIWTSDGRDELYNVQQDPEELNNLIEAEPKKAEELKALLREWLNSFETYKQGAAQLVK